LVPVAAAMKARATERDAKISGQLPGQLWRSPSDFVVRINRESHQVSVRSADRGYTVLCFGRSVRIVSDWGPGDMVFTGHIDGHPVTAQVQPNGLGYTISHLGARAEVEVLAKRTAELASFMPVKVPPDTSKLIMSPMPGLLLRISVAPGDEVQEGQEVAVVEAMKMENILRAERPGVVKSVNAGAGDSLAADQIIVEFE
jgi:propionyl-CoA carboxylase alpha chain